MEANQQLVEALSTIAALQENGGGYSLEDEFLEEAVEAAVGEEEEEDVAQAEEDTQEDEDTQSEYTIIRIIAILMDTTFMTLMGVRLVTLQWWEIVMMKPWKITKVDLKRIGIWWFDMNHKLM